MGRSGATLTALHPGARRLLHAVIGAVADRGGGDLHSVVNAGTVPSLVLHAFLGFEIVETGPRFAGIEFTGGVGVLLSRPMRPESAPACAWSHRMERPAPTAEVCPIMPGDTDAVVALWERALPEYGDPPRPQRPSIRRRLDWGDGLFWLAVSDEEAVGTVMAGYDGHRGWICSLAVHPDQRRGGLGTALVAHAEQELARLGCPKVNLQFTETNADGAEF